jgi:hypothetical protein
MKPGNETEKLTLQARCDFGIRARHPALSLLQPRNALLPLEASSPSAMYEPIRHD